MPCYETFSSTSVRMCFNASFDFFCVVIEVLDSETLVEMLAGCEAISKTSVTQDAARHDCSPLPVRSRRWTEAA